MLLYYAEQAEGFRPAQLTIHRATGIPETRIKNIRRNLEKMTLIEYVFNENYHYIFVNWTVICGYALLGEPLQVGGRGRRNFVQQSQSEYSFNPQEREKYKAENILTRLYAEDNTEWLARLSDQEYRNACRVIARATKQNREDISE